MGFTDIVERFGYRYESEEAYELMDEVMEFISWHAIDASADLARERGAYPNFEGSRWCKGWCRSTPSSCSRPTAACRSRSTGRQRLDWDALRAKVPAGIRNATLMAIAPTASIGLVAGTTPGLDPQFSQIFSRATSAGKFLEVNRNLVEDLRASVSGSRCARTCSATRATCRRSTSVPDELKAIYRTSFQLSPYAFLNVAARAQKWIDQAISRNIYLAPRRRRDGRPLRRRVADGRQDDLLPAHDAAAHRRAEHRQGQQGGRPPAPAGGARASRVRRGRRAGPGDGPGRRRPVDAVGAVPSSTWSTGPPAPSTRRSDCSASRASESSVPDLETPVPLREDDHDAIATPAASSAPASSEGLLLKPVTYQWAMDLYDQAVANTWFPNEIQLGEDLADFERMTDEERHALTFLMSYFNPNELLVNKALAFGVYPYVNAAECHLYLAKQMWEEANHCMAFEYVLETFPIDREAAYDVARRPCPRWRPRRSSRSASSRG